MMDWSRGRFLARLQSGALQLKVPVHSLAWLKARLGLEAEGEAGAEGAEG